MEVAIHPAAPLLKLAVVARFLLAEEAALTTPALVPTVPSTTTPATTHMPSLITMALVRISV